jgi:3-dehydroquinate dehydratase / shikimate dehydrogenase
MLCVTVARTRHKAMLAEYEFVGQQGADLTELRLDYIGRSIDLPRLLSKRHTPVVVTCRLPADGGRWGRSEQERQMILRSAIAAGVDYVDLEGSIAGTIPRYGSTKRIVSLHDLEKTPENLEEIHSQLASKDADIVKIATQANSFDDCIRMMQLVRNAQFPTIGICMGDIGAVTRILSLYLGSPFTYCAMTTERKIAPGMITFEQMQKLYRPQQINDQTQLFGVVADPVAHSLSPLIHNTAFAHQGLNCRYLPFRIPDVDLRQFMNWCLDTDVGGLSVTIPHKETMLEFVQECESAARGIGAINTVVFRNGSGVGYNTDYRAAMDCIQEALRTQKTLQTVEGRDDDLFRGRSVLILGAGGVARAIAYGLKQRGALVTIASRTLERAHVLGRELKVNVVSWSERYSMVPGIIVNCSPVGMHPDIDSTPYDISKQLSAETIVFDTVYNPENTVLIKAARQAGCLTINGLDMFVRQAAYQYKLFTGQEPPVPLMRETVKRATSPVNF